MLRFEYLDTLEIFKKLSKYWGIVTSCGHDIYPLDWINFCSNVFPETISPIDVYNLHMNEPGYTSSDGSTELGDLIRDLETSRLLKCGHNSSKNRIFSLVQKAGLGIGNGCTNVTDCLFRSILKYSSETHHSRINKASLPEIILAVPNYMVYAAQLSNLQSKLNVIFVTGENKLGYLPTAEEVIALVNEKTIAIAITYPSNPCQSMYEKDSKEDILKLVQFCQTNRVFLVVDCIYQDLIFPKDRYFLEPFSLTNEPNYLIKIYGSSKDTPFFSGYRIGYWFGDPDIARIYKCEIASSDGGLNSHSISMMAVNLYLKNKKMQNQEILEDDMKYFMHGIFGSRVKVSKNHLFENFQKMNLQKKYNTNIGLSDTIQETSLYKLRESVSNLPAFSEYINSNIGNTFFIKVNPTYFHGTDDIFFDTILAKTGIAVLPGSALGMSLYKNDEIWFRITTVQDHIDNIITKLENINNFLVKSI